MSNEDLIKSFGAYIRDLREARKWSVADLTERLHFSSTYLNKVELGELLPHVDVAVDLAGAFGVPFDDLAERLARSRRAKRVETQQRAARRRALAPMLEAHR